MNKRRLRLGVFYGALFPVLAISIVTGIAIGSTAVDWRLILHVIGIKLLPAGWVDPVRRHDPLRPVTPLRGVAVESSVWYGSA